MAQPATATSDPTELRWDLSDLYKSDDDPALERDFAASKDAADTLARHRGTVVAMRPAALCELLAEYERLLVLTWRPGVYASLRFSADTGDAAAQALLGRAREHGARLSTVMRFVDVEIKTAPEVAFAGWADAAELAPYHHFLKAARRGAPHTLSEPEERVATLKGLTGAAAWSQL